MADECAFCEDKLFIDYGPNGIRRGLCFKHAQEVTLERDLLRALLRRIYESMLTSTVSYLITKDGNS